MKKLIALSLIAIFGVANEITLGVVPQQSPLKLSKKWSKITDYLQEETGLNIVFKTKNSIPKFEDELYKGSYDISYMNPYHFTVANRTQGYEALVRADKQIIGILLAKNTEFVFTKENLKGKTFLFPAPNAFAATLLTKYELKQKYDFDVDNEARVLYVNSHDSVYKGIARDVGDLGSGIIRTYNNFKSLKDKDMLNVVYKTEKYPSHPIAYHPQMKKDDIEKIKNAFLNMPEDLKYILSIKNFIETTTKEYDAIKEIN